MILPVGDDRRFLAGALESMFRQTFSRLEIVLVDDARCPFQLSNDDPRLRYLRNPGRGIVDALNAGAAIARGELFARMDADDIALPERIERQVDLLAREPEVGIVGAQVEIFVDEGEVGLGFRRYQRWVNALCRPAAIGREIFIESPIPHPSAVIRRSVFEHLGGYRSVPWAEDYDLWLRACEAGVAMAKPDGILLRWRDHPRRLSRNDRRCSLSSFMKARAHFLVRRCLQDRAAVIWGAAPTGAALYDALCRSGVEVKAFIDIDPRKIGGAKRGKPVLPPAAVEDVGDALVLGAVAAPGGRASIREFLSSCGRREGCDFLFVA